MTRRSGWAAIIASLSVLLIAVGFTFLRSSSTPVDVGTAVERFRAAKTVPVRSEQAIRVEQHSSVAVGTHPSREADPRRSVTAVAPKGRPLPAEGVYVYATTGGDDVDVLGGSRHQYPDETTVTVRHNSCGFVERWDALDERWDERESCRTAAGDELHSTTSHHEFFGKGDTRTLRCSGLTYPAGAEPGDAWTLRCASASTSAVIQMSAVAWENVDVAGTAVRTLHVHAVEKISGDQVGSGVRDVWGSRETGIVIRERSEMTSYSNQPVFGRTRYHEAYEVKLRSLEARR
jgi:hypothetical protein